MQISRRRMSVLLAATAAGLAGCGGGGSSVVEIVFSDLEGDFQGTWPVRNYVLRTDAEWQAAWNEHGVMTNEIPPRPVVDFNRYVLLGISRGLASCQSLLVRGVSLQDGRLVVRYQIVAPPAGTLCAAVLTPLIRFIIVPVLIFDGVAFEQVS